MFWIGLLIGSGIVSFLFGINAGKNYTKGYNDGIDYAIATVHEKIAEGKNEF